MTTLETIPIPVPTMPLAVLVAKNRGLHDQIRRALSARCLPSGADVMSVRGEDVALLAGEFGRAGRRVLAFTGDDLVDEWLAAGNALGESLVRDRVAWNDPYARYGAPALCLIGRPGEPLEARVTPWKVAVCLRYRSLAGRFMQTLLQDGIAFESIVVTGEVETCVSSGVADLAIDIVLTGRTLDRLGLAAKRVISTSDVAVLETK